MNIELFSVDIPLLKKALALAGVTIVCSLVPLTASAGAFDEMSVSALGGKSDTTWHGQMDVQSLNIEFTNLLSPRFEAGVAVAPMSVWQPRSWFGSRYGDGNERVFAISGLAVGRLRLLQDSERMNAYAELAGGPMWAEKQVPASTSRFNFTTQLGAGLILAPQSRAPVFIGWRYLHISNGGYSPRNPGLNVQSLVVGVRFRIATPPRR